MSQPEAMRRAAAPHDLTACLFTACLFTACTVSEPAPPPPAAETPQVAPEGAADPTAEDSVPIGEMPPGMAKAEDLSAALQRLGSLMTEVRAAVDEAGRTAQGDDCAKARVIFLASNEALRASLAKEPLPGGRTPPTWQVPAPETFQARCQQLPADVQHCLRLDMRGQERETCGPLMRDLPADQKALVDELAKSAVGD